MLLDYDRRKGKKEYTTIVNEFDFPVFKRYPQIEGMHLYKRFMLSIYNMHYDEEGNALPEFKQTDTMLSFLTRLGHLDSNYQIKPFLKNMKRHYPDDDFYILDLCPVLDRYNRLEMDKRAYELKELPALRKQKHRDRLEFASSIMVEDCSLIRIEDALSNNKASYKLATVFAYAMMLDVSKLLITSDLLEGDDEW